MSCARAFDIDLAGYLDAPRSTEFAEFRMHYPRCEACSAEVRAWTELAEELGSARHPTPDELAGYAGSSVSERAAIDRHAAQCPACREELQLLDAFDPATWTQPAPARPPARQAAGWLEALARIFWHPAFAYGVAVLVVVPILWRSQGPGRFGDGVALEPRAELAALRYLDEPSAPSDERAEGAAAEISEEPAPAPTRSAERQAPPDVTLAAAKKSVAATRVPLAPAPIAPEPATPALAASAPTPPDVAGRLAAQNEALREMALPESQGVELQTNRPREESAAPLPQRTAEAETRERSRSLREAPRKAPAIAPVVGFDADTRALAFAATGASNGSAGKAPAALARIVLATAPERVSLRVPVAAGARRSVEIHVSDAQRGRALQQLAEAAPDAAEVAIELPRAWLSPGEYRVELRDGAAALRVFELSVVAQ
jgi:hypothetical protein